MYIIDLLTSMQHWIDIHSVSSMFGGYKVGLLLLFLDLALFVVEGDCLSTVFFFPLLYICSAVQCT